MTKAPIANTRFGLVATHRILTQWGSMWGILLRREFSHILDLAGRLRHIHRRNYRLPTEELGRPGYPRLNKGRNVWIPGGVETSGFPSAAPNSAPSAAKGRPMWQIESRRRKSARFGGLSEKSARFGRYPRSGSRAAQFPRGALSVISPIQMANATGPNPGEAHIATHRILLRRKAMGPFLMGRVNASQFGLILASGRARSPYGSVKLHPRHIGNGSARLSYRD